MAAHPLATLVHPTEEGLVADHIPLILEPAPQGWGRLLGHVASSNPLSRAEPGREVLVIFHGPSHYISPHWYASKSDGGEVVPTWNYVVIHAQCRQVTVTDPERLLATIEALTNQQERSSPNPWRVTDAPTAYTQRLLRHIVGIELHIHRLEGKWKVSQNQPAHNRASVVHGLRSLGTAAAADMAECVAARDQTRET